MAVVHVLSNVFPKTHVSRAAIRPELPGASIQMALIKFVSMQLTAKENQLWKQTAPVHVRFNVFPIHASRMETPMELQCVKIQMDQRKSVLIPGWFHNYSRPVLLKHKVPKRRRVFSLFSQ